MAGNFYQRNGQITTFDSRHDTRRGHVRAHDAGSRQAPSLASGGDYCHIHRCASMTPPGLSNMD